MASFDLGRVQDEVEQNSIKVSVIREKPAIYDRLKSRFQTIDWEKGLAIVFGDKIYAKFPLPNDVIAHELMHVKQQKEMGAVVWWDKYLEDDEFRLSQEIEAYQAQAKYIREHTEQSNRDWRRMALKRIAQDLSSSIYGNMISYDKACQLLG